MVVFIFATKWLYYDRKARRISSYRRPYQKNDYSEIVRRSAKYWSNRGRFGITRQGIAKHLKVLHECGMISLSQKGREQFCEARLDQLDLVVDWVNESRKLWNQRFKKLDKFLAKTKKQ
jgi:DNA-binding transcriptional ArsR family regulator